ncbi:MAG: WbqC family protein [Phycisphaerae bacterium]
MNAGAPAPPAPQHPAAAARAARVVAISQSNYIPWKGYFDLIRQADEFVLLDDVQFTRRDWRNRNQIKTPRGREWLTIPVEVKGKFTQAIKDVRIADGAWKRQHRATITHNYAKAGSFREQLDLLHELYDERAEPFLSDVNRRFLARLCDVLGIRTRITASMDYALSDGKTERLLDLCLKLGATEYLSGPAAQDYLDVAAFERAGVRVRWMSYRGYPEHRQLFPPFEHGVSVLDLILNEGAAAARFLNRSESA